MEFVPVADGFYLEALAVESDEVWFSDVIGGGIGRVTAGAASGTWRDGTLWLAGLQLNEDGLVLSSGGGGICWVDPATGRSGDLIRTIAGEPIPGVSEMTPDRCGGLYFGTVDIPAIEQGRQTGPVAIYHLTPDGIVTKVSEDLRFTNGLSLSPDGRRIYHNESFVGVFAYDVNADGTLGGKTLLIDKTDCDGMAIDAEGGIWVTGFASPELIRLLPDGQVNQRLPLPGPAATNVRFGGTDGRDLYVNTVSPKVAAGLAEGRLPTEKLSTLFKSRADIPGRPIERTRFRPTAG